MCDCTRPGQRCSALAIADEVAAIEATLIDKIGESVKKALQDVKIIIQPRPGAD